MTQPPSFPPPIPGNHLAPPAQGYGSYPAMRPVGAAAGPPPAAPRTVTQVFVLMLARAVLGVVSLVVTFATRDQVRRIIERQQQLQTQRTGRPSPIDPDQLVDIALGVGVVVGLVFLVFYVFLAFKVRRGRQWARVVTWVFAGLGALGLITQFLVPATVVSRVVGTATGVLDIAIIVLLALRPTSAYITEMSARRRR